ncbi:hypothetical protein SAMN05444424_1559 [Bittarella massiliensis (ex Durand et al. 2017)]|uniref:Uncharacterized protein n=1 Tax=Bittarella massiliensis (ex Durand et al. 2017) TaxID=1720313 RepID=A0AAQ1RVY6_9FIRM|nr:hypothetical protein SAMN05444424_1559 [Bittarella massiliensis (ex Durand et al. 2017)]
MPTALLRSFYFGLKGISSAGERPITGQHPSLKTAPQIKRRRRPVCQAAASFRCPFCAGEQRGGEEKFCAVREGGRYPGRALPRLCSGAPLSQYAPVPLCPCSDVSLSRWASTTASPCPGASVSAYLHLNVPSFQCAFVPVCACFSMDSTPDAPPASVCACFGMGPTPPCPLLVQACHRHAPVLACFCLGALLFWHASISARPHSSAHLFWRIPVSRCPHPSVYLPQCASDSTWT